MTKMTNMKINAPVMDNPSIKGKSILSGFVSAVGDEASTFIVNLIRLVVNPGLRMSRIISAETDVVWPGFFT